MKRLVLLLHGNSGSSRDLEPLARLFRAQGVDVLNPDLPLHGKNKKYSTPLTIDNCADSVSELLGGDDLELTVVGFSDGANIALSLLRRKTFPITDLVLISPNSSAREILPAWRLLFHASRFALALVLYLPPLRRIYRRLGMMITYHQALDFPKKPGRTLLVYAQRDLIALADQERIAKSLAVEVRRIEHSTHFTVVHSPALVDLLRRELLDEKQPPAMSLDQRARP